MDIQRVTYTSKPIKLPNGFLTGRPARPVTLHPIDFAYTPLPEYRNAKAFVIKNVLSEAECRKLIQLAEMSAPVLPDRGSNNAADKTVDGGRTAPSPWRPALVNVGRGMEASAAGYRESDRIIWDRQEVVDRIWERCKLADGVWEQMKELGSPRRRWVFKRGNERMRFLKYGKGQFFKPHCDAPYYDESSKEQCRTFYTLHLYLNDSVEAQEEEAEAAEEGGEDAGYQQPPELRGGATSFLSGDELRRLDVNPKAGSVLIFQHSGLYHEGAVVESGVKYTMRTDLLYEFQRGSEEEDL